MAPGQNSAGRAAASSSSTTGFRVVLDLGYGTLPRLLELLGSVHADGLDAVATTHEHPEHAIEEDDVTTIQWVFDWHERPAAPYEIGPFRPSSWARRLRSFLRADANASSSATHGLVLATRDRRALPTYQALNVPYELIGEG